MPTLQVDCAYDCDHDHETKAYASKHGCEVKLLEEFGPAGGNPLYEFSGTKEALTSLIKNFYSFVDITYHVSRIRD